MVNILIEEQAVNKTPAAVSALQSDLFQSDVEKMAEDHRNRDAAVGCS